VHGASSRINGLQGPKFSTNIQNIDKKDEEVKKLRSQTYWREMKPDHDPTTHQHAQAGSQKKGKDSISETKSSTTFHKGRIFTKRSTTFHKGRIFRKSTSPLTSSWARYE
jgi:hypothetical protein